MAVSITAPILHTHSFIYHPWYITQQLRASLNKGLKLRSFVTLRRAVKQLLAFQRNVMPSASGSSSSLFSDSLSLKMKAWSYFETSVTIYYSTGHNIPEDSNHPNDNLQQLINCNLQRKRCWFLTTPLVARRSVTWATHIYRRERRKALSTS